MPPNSLDDKTWRYLSVLELEDPGEITGELRSLVESDPYLTEGGRDGHTVELPFLESVSVGDDCPDTRLEFYRWLAGQLSRRREQKYDQLTGLYTRSYWEREVKDSAQRQDWAVVLGDIDHFKQFNDNYGHDMGDRVLSGVGEFLREELPDDCHLVRYGGEEILVLMDCELSRASERVDRLRARLADHRLFPDQPTDVTMSFGLAGHEQGESIEETIKQADLALYESKDSGRNRLTPYAPYLDYSSRLYVWGIYRYVWSPTVRFCMAEDGLQFLMYWGNTLQWYNWQDNDSELRQLPDGFTEPVRMIRRFGQGFVMLDGEAELWFHPTSDRFKRASGNTTPAVVDLAGQEDRLHVIGVNNQLYELSKNGAARKLSLPDCWDQVVVTDAIYVIVENVMIRWEDGACTESWPLPEPPRQITSSGENIVLVGQSGRLFKFQPDANHWEQTQFMNLLGSRVPCRSVSSAGDRMLILDEHGRLLLIYEGGDRRKSVPQVMELSPPDR